MWKWGAFAIFGGLLVGLIVYVQLFEEKIERHEVVTKVAISDIVTGILGDEPEEGNWSGYKNFFFNESELTGAAQQTMDAVLDDARYPEEYTLVVSTVEKAFDEDEVRNLIQYTRAQMAIARGSAVSEDFEKALTTIRQTGEITRNSVETAVEVEQWLEAQGARSLFIDAVEASLKNDGWSQELALQLSNELEATSNRTALSSALRQRFATVLQLAIVIASESIVAAEIAAEAMHDEPTDSETDQLAKLLHRHPKAFNPEATAESGAETLKLLIAALEGPWDGTQTLLDQFAEMQLAWFEYQDFLLMSETDRSAGTEKLKLKFGKIDNPVGMAVLHDERTSWSNLAQAAYVADANEAEFKIMLLNLAGRTSDATNVIDPLTGETGSNPVEIGENYSFIKSYEDERQSP